MDMNFEFKKLYLKQRGVLIVLLVIFFEIIMRFITGYDSNYIIDRNENTYHQYLQEYEGKITSQKIQSLQEEYQNVKKAAAKIQDCKEQYQKEKITKEEYQEIAKKYFRKTNNGSVFNIVYNQYIYAKEDVTQRYMLDTRGWETLLCHQDLNMILVIGIVVLCSPLFCWEYESDMEQILLYSRYGKYHSAVKKFLTAIVSAIILVLLCTAVDYCYVANSVGLAHADYPLKSIQFFENSPYHMTLGNAYLCIVLFRIIGAVMASCLVCIIAIISKKIIITLVASSLVFISPSIIFSTSSVGYYLPIPSRQICATGYLWGTSYATSISETGEKYLKVIFREIPVNQCKLLMCAYSVEIILMIIFGVAIFSRNSVHIEFRKLKIFVLVWAIAAFEFVGCGSVKSTPDDIVYSAYDNYIYGKTNGKELFLDVEAKNIILKENGNQLKLLREIPEEEKEIDAIFVYDNFCYYITREENYEGFQVYGLNLSDFSRQLIYSSVKENQEDFFGLVENKVDENEMMDSMTRVVSALIVNDNYIYIQNGTDILRIDRKTKKQKVIVQNVSESCNLCYISNCLYYFDSEYRLYKFVEAKGSIERIGEVYTDDLRIEAGNIKYTDFFNG